MEIKIQSIHFDATDKLEAFIEKKVAKLEKGVWLFQERHFSWRKQVTLLRKVPTFVWTQ